ncbi:MAG: ROK family protein [Pseudomonadota bacterium]
MVLKEMEGESASLVTAVTVDPGAGCGPLIPLTNDPARPLRQQIFERVRAAGSLARIEISKELGVSPGSVTAATAELIEAGLLSEIATPRPVGDTTRGRPPVALGVARGAGLVAGIKLSDRAHCAVILDHAGVVLGQANRSNVHRRKPVADMIEDVAAVLDDALATVVGRGMPRPVPMAVGLGLPGIVDHEAGHVHWSPLLDATDVALQDRLTARLGLPVRLDNDANLVTLAELWFGVGRALPDFAVVTVEHGLGMGLVLGHRLFRGARGLGMELGHTKVALDGALCRCGQRGCLEAYVADYALMREAVTLFGWDAPDAAPEALLERLAAEAAAGNAEAVAILRRAGRYLALGIANIVNLLDPGLILLAGNRLRRDPLLAQEVRHALSSFMLGRGRVPPRIEIQEEGDMRWAQGAAALALALATDRMLGAEAA